MSHHVEFAEAALESFAERRRIRELVQASEKETTLEAVERRLTALEEVARRAALANAEPSRCFTCEHLRGLNEKEQEQRRNLARRCRRQRIELRALQRKIEAWFADPVGP